MEANRVAAPFQYHALKIVVEQDARHPTPCIEGGGMAAQKALHPGVPKEAEKNPPRVAEHHDEGHQRSPRAADLKMAEVTTRADNAGGRRART